MLPIDRLWPKHAFRFGGGGGTSGGSDGGIASVAAPAASPPVTSSAAEVVQASQDLRRQSLKKRGFSQTVFAGDTGGWQRNNTNPSPTTPKIQNTGGGMNAKTLGA